VISVFVRNLAFSIVVVGIGAGWLPWSILEGRTEPSAGAGVWPAAAVIALGLALYLWCVWMFAVVGRGTPGPWDAPRQVVVAGPYRWVRNPIYIAAMLVVLGEAWLFLSVPLLIYVAVMAIGFNLFVVFYEEPTLRRRFGDTYVEYRLTVRRWLPRRPRHD
jgi:protein-S-isoprenylcysteine O-methyltransferase Ste14